MLESIMRYTPVAVAAALTMLTVSTALHSQRTDDQIDPRSQALVAQARQLQAAGKLDDATDTLHCGRILWNGVLSVRLSRQRWRIVFNVQKVVGRMSRTAGQVVAGKELQAVFPLYPSKDRKR
jgi:hypothetical protein